MTAPATEAQIVEAEKEVGVEFPSDLRSLYLQTDGILDDGYGPILSLSGSRAAPFVDSNGNPVKGERFPAHNYSVVQYTQLQRKLWEDDAGVSHDTFVVIGVDIGGNPYGFFGGPGKQAIIKCVAHDDGSIDDNEFSLEGYLRHYFVECPWFTDEN